MSIDVASLASAVATGVSALGVGTAAAELARRTRRMEAGSVTIRRTETRRAEAPEVLDARGGAKAVLAALNDVSATEYALDADTRTRIDAQIDHAVERLKRASESESA